MSCREWSVELFAPDLDPRCALGTWTVIAAIFLAVEAQRWCTHYRHTWRRRRQWATRAGGRSKVMNADASKPPPALPPVVVEEVVELAVDSVSTNTAPRVRFRH